MKHSEFNTNQSNFGIQISPLEINKSFSLAEQGISVSNPNSNTLMINSVIPTHININSSGILNPSLNNQRSINIPEVKNYNLAIVAKPNSTSNPSINSNIIPFHANNTIKLVNLPKCHQISNIKDSNSTVHNNTINVQFVSNTSNSGCTESSISLQPTCKIDSITLNPSSMTTSATNQTVSTNSSSLATTRIIIQGASQFLHQGTLTFIPQTSEMTNNSIANNHLIKNPKCVFTGKQHHQTIRPIATGSTSSVVSQNNITKQPINIISPSKTIGPISTFNIPEVPNQTVIQDLPVNLGMSVHNDSQRSSKNVSVKIPIQSYSVSSNNNIRLALTSSMNSSRTAQSKIQFISPKSRKRSGSPLNVLQDSKIRNQPIGPKNENVDNSPNNYANQLGNYSPTRKRARKQHLKSVNTKSQKPIINQKLMLNNKIESANHLNNIRPAMNEKILPVVVPSNSGSKVSFPNKIDDGNVSTSTSTPINAQIIIGLKNTILCPSKTSSTNQSNLAQRPTTIYANNTNSNSSIIGPSPNTPSGTNTTTITPINQFQIIGQNSNFKQIQLSPNFILSSKIKYQAPFSPSKVIHIAPSVSNISRAVPVKNEVIVTESIVASAASVIEDKTKVSVDKSEKSAEPVKSESVEIKSETSEDSNIKISLFPIKYNWNPRRNHFMKKSDVKFKKSKSNLKFNSNLSGSENLDEITTNTDIEARDVNWLFYKAMCQIMMQKKFDEENLHKIYQLKEKFNTFHKIDDVSRPIFHQICSKTQTITPVPDRIDIKCLSKYADPHLFGITEDIIDNYVNSLTKNDCQPSDETLPNSIAHECDSSCIFYSAEVPPSSPPRKFSRIIDLIEGLIVKEKSIIEKECEINNQFMKMLRNSSDFTSQNKKFPHKTNNHSDRFKMLTGFRR